MITIKDFDTRFPKLNESYFSLLSNEDKELYIKRVSIYHKALLKLINSEIKLKDIEISLKNSKNYFVPVSNDKKDIYQLMADDMDYIYLRNNIYIERLDNSQLQILDSENYDDIATTHDMFMLKPFIDKAYVIPIAETQVEKIEQSADYMLEELTEQRDWYWSCRGRSYFMEIIIALERMYGLIGYGLTHQKSDNAPIIKNPKLRDAVLYIEGHYGDSITLSDISANAGINHTTLTALMKEELGCTAIEYLMQYRITIAKKQLAFTDVPIKDIANMIGFKTVQHFNRIFKQITGTTPADFRKTAVQKRKDEIK